MARCFWNSSKCYRTFAVLTLLSCNFDPIVCPSKCYKFGNPNNDSSFNNKKNKSITTCASGALDVEPMVILSSVKIVEQVSYTSFWLTNIYCEKPFVSNASVILVTVLQSSLETAVPVESADPTLNKS